MKPTLGERLSEYGQTREWVECLIDDHTAAVQALEDWRIAAGEIVPDAADDPPAIQDVVQLRKLYDLLRTYLDIEWPRLSLESLGRVVDGLYATVRPWRSVHDSSALGGVRRERRHRPTANELCATMTDAVDEITRLTDAIMLKPRRDDERPPPTSDSTEPEQEELTETEARAYELWSTATRDGKDRKTYKQVFEELRESGMKDWDNAGAFKRRVTAAKGKMKSLKNSPRAGRSGRSIVRADEL
ncbi:MAG: hypothetical protein WD294_15575 [Phycisphaeraceae bacterium]